MQHRSSSNLSSSSYYPRGAQPWNRNVRIARNWTFNGEISSKLNFCFTWTVKDRLRWRTYQKKYINSCVYFLILKYVIIAADGTSLSQSVGRSVGRSICLSGILLSRQKLSESSKRPQKCSHDAGWYLFRLILMSAIFSIENFIGTSLAPRVGTKQNISRHARKPSGWLLIDIFFDCYLSKELIKRYTCLDICLEINSPNWINLSSREEVTGQLSDCTK